MFHHSKVNSTLWEYFEVIWCTLLIFISFGHLHGKIYFLLFFGQLWKCVKFRSFFYILRSLVQFDKFWCTSLDFYMLIGLRVKTIFFVILRTIKKNCKILIIFLIFQGHWCSLRIFWGVLMYVSWFLYFSNIQEEYFWYFQTIMKKSKILMFFFIFYVNGRYLRISFRCFDVDFLTFICFVHLREKK